MNVDIIEIKNINETRNFTCHAQNSFGLIIFNLSVVLKGNLFIYFIFILNVVLLIVYRLFLIEICKTLI
jgi:hypothetical protein